MISKLMLGLADRCCIFIFLIPVLLSPALSLANTSDQQLARINSSMHTLRIPFVANQGQMDEHVAFSAKTLGGTLFVTTEGELVYSLSGSQKDSPDRQIAVIRECLLGGRVGTVEGFRPSTTRVNYFRGNDSAKWVSAVKTYMEIGLGEVYDGIELRLKAYGNNVEKLFYVAPGAEPGMIRLKVSGTDSLKINDRGELVLTTPHGPVAFTRPVAWQEIDGETVAVPAGYELLASGGRHNEYSFATGAYDPAHPLIIDPLLASTILGGSGNDTGHSIAVDSQGNIYVAGETESSDFPVAGGYDAGHNGGNQDVFVSKLSADMTTLLASTFIGGAGQDIAYSIAIDASDKIYIAGTTASPGYPATAYDTTFNTSAGLTDAFVTRLSSDLSTLDASTFIGGADSDEAFSLAISSGNIYVTGYTLSTNFPTTAGAYDQVHNENKDIFVVKLSSGLSVLDASTFIGGSVYDYGRSLAFDSQGNVFITGNTASHDFPSTTGLDFVFGEGPQVIVAKLSSDLSALQAASIFGAGGVVTSGYGIAVDSSDNIYITGGTDSPTFPTTEGAFDRSSDSFEAFVTRLNSGLDTILASTCLGMGSWEWGFSLVLDESDNVYVTGYTQSADFQTTPLSYDSSHNGGYDVFITKFKPDLTGILASTYLGGNGTEWARSMTRDAAGNIYVTGNQHELTIPFPTTAGAYDSSWNGVKDVFVSKLDPDLVGPSLQFSAASYHVNEFESEATITVTRSGSSTGAVSVAYATSDGTATADSDYTAASGTLNWDDGDAADKTFSVPIIADSEVEGVETITLTLSNPTGIVFGSPQIAALTIVDDEDPGDLQFSAPAFNVNENGVTATITVTRTGGSDGPVSVDYATSDGTAVADTDYTAASGTLAWVNGETDDKTFSVDITDNDQIDGDRTVILSLADPTGGALLGARDTAVLTIHDDEVAGSLQFSLESFPVAEDVGQAVVTVTRTGGSDGAVTVEYYTSDDTAFKDSDYSESTGTLSWADGDDADKTFLVAILDDAVIEGEEKVTLTLHNQSGSVTLGSPNVANINISDNDASVLPGTLQFNMSAFSVSEGGVQATITVTRTGGSDGSVSVDFATSDGTAVVAEDYTAASGTLNWNDQEANSQTFTVAINDDPYNESDETVVLTLSNPTGGAALGATNTATLTIVDNDTSSQHGSLQFSVSSYYVWENDGSFSVTVTRTDGDDGEVAVDFGTSDGTAEVGGDYDEMSGLLTWADGEVGDKTFDVNILDDTDSEGDETVVLTLSNPTGGAVLGARSSATLSIQDNDVSPQHGTLQFSSSAYSVSESAGQLTITVTRTGGSDGDITVTYATGDGTAVVNDDYYENIGNLDWSDGDSASKTFVVFIEDDSEEEGDETLSIFLTNPVGGATLGSIQNANIKILDNEFQQPKIVPIFLNLLLGGGD
jgi:Calx-beta domain/Beta-propeller repeat